MRSRSIAAIAAAGITAATLGVGGVAMANASPTAPPVSPAATATTNPGAAGHRRGAHHGVHNKAGHLPRRALHVQWVTRDGKAFVTHDAIRGQVTAVSKTAITVKAQDGTQETYAVTGTTKVRMRMAGKAAPKAQAGKAQPGSVSGIHVGERVVVVGTGTSSLKATRIMVRLGALNASRAPQAG